MKNTKERKEKLKVNYKKERINILQRLYDVPTPKIEKLEKNERKNVPCTNLQWRKRKRISEVAHQVHPQLFIDI